MYCSSYLFRESLIDDSASTWPSARQCLSALGAQFPIAVSRPQGRAKLPLV